mmetsp:Transcript_25733/g.38501  ORF Transcript_25733/g.38501 Transcript_25733/m.38501 type:complete len:81 (-) Transcript_25733:664-906(-)
MSGKKYKLIALDLDGTLLDNEHRVTDENAKYLRDLQKRGVIVSMQIILCCDRRHKGIGIKGRHTCCMRQWSMWCPCRSQK